MILYNHHLRRHKTQTPILCTCNCRPSSVVRSTHLKLLQLCVGSGIAFSPNVRLPPVGTVTLVKSNMFARTSAVLVFNVLILDSALLLLFSNDAVPRLLSVSALKSVLVISTLPFTSVAGNL